MRGSRSCFIEAERIEMPGYPFFDRMNRILVEAGFDGWVKTVASPFYRWKEERESVPSEVYCRMLFLG